MSDPLLLFLLDQMTAICARWREFAELVADHVLGHVHGHVAASIMNGNRVTDHLRDNRAGPAPLPAPRRASGRRD